MKKKIGLILLVLVLSLSFSLVPSISVYADPDPGIVGLWHFDGDPFDSSGYGNDGIVSGAIYTPGRFGQALSFDGIDDSVVVPYNSSLNFDTGAWEVWVNFSKLPSEITTNSSVNIITKRGSGVPQYWTHASGINDSIFVGVTISGNTYAVYSPPNYIETGKWYHVVGIYDGEVLKLSINGELFYDDTPSGPIDQGTENLTMAARPGQGIYFDGIIDEVHIWNTPFLMYTLTANPLRDINPVDTNHTIIANVYPVAPGARVRFFVLPNSVNYGKDASAPTNISGVATFNYNDDSLNGGTDSIRVWIDRDLSGDFDENKDAWMIVRKSWVENFVTGGGKINVPNSKKPALSLAGMVGVLPDGGVTGQFQIVDHVNKVAYHMNDFSWLIFMGGPAESPSATHNTAMFVGLATGNDGSIKNFKITIRDFGEPGIGVDTILVEETIPGPPSPGPQPPAPPGITIDGGNFQVHNLE